MQPSLSSSSFVGYTWAFPFHFLGCTPTCSPFLWDLLMFSPFERYPHLLILFFFFFEGYTSTVPLFSRRHPRKPFSFSGVHLHSSFYPGSTHASVPPAFFFFFLGCTQASPPPFLWDALPISSFFQDAPLPPPPFFCKIHSHSSCFCGMNSRFVFFFRMHSSISSFVFLPSNLIHRKDQLLPGSLGTIPCASLRIPTAQPPRNSHTHPKNPH